MGLEKNSIVTQTFMKVCGKREYMKVVVSMLGIRETFILEIGKGAATLKVHKGDLRGLHPWICTCTIGERA